MVVDALIITEAAVARQRGLAVLSDTGRQIEVSLNLSVLALKLESLSQVHLFSTATAELTASGWFAPPKCRSGFRRSGKGST